MRELDRDQELCKHSEQLSPTGISNTIHTVLPNLATNLTTGVKHIYTLPQMYIIQNICSLLIRMVHVQR